MKAIRIHHFGSFEQLKYEDITVPPMNDDQILVKVYATSVNHLEIKKASGEFNDLFKVQLPWIPGHDFAGVVEKTGKNVTTVKVGDSVYGNTNGGHADSDSGSYAEFMVADTSKTALMPSNLSFVEAATVPHVGETAWQAIQYGKLKAGEKVLIHGAAGAVGSFAVQFARNIGAQIYATASAGSRALLESYGVDQMIDYKTTDFSKVLSGMDLVLVFTGGDTQEKSYNVLKKGGRLVSITGPIIENLAKEHEVSGISMAVKQSGDDLRQITKLIESGKVKTLVGAEYELKEAAKAWKAMLGVNPAPQRITQGKIVLKVNNTEK